MSGGPVSVKLGAMAKKKSTKPPKRGKGDSMGGESEMEGELRVAHFESVVQMTESSVQTSSSMKSNRIVICKSSGCHDVATSGEFCRLHYLANWKKLKSKEAKNQGIGLEGYLKEMASRFPEEFFEKLRSDIEELSSEAISESEDNSESLGRGLFDVDSEEDMDDIMKGIRIEDY